MKTAPDRLAALEEERDFLLRSLDDLDREHDAGDIDEHDYTTLRDGYTARAATVLRAIDSHRAALLPRRPRRWSRLLAWGGGLLALAVLAGGLVAWGSGQRLPGDTSSGDIAQSVTSKLAEARSLFSTDAKGAIQRYDEVLKVEPDNAEALTYEGWLVALVGNQANAPDLVARGAANINRATQVAPNYADAFCFQAIVRFRMQSDAAGAAPAIDKCLALNPPQETLGLVQGLKAEIAAGLAGGTTPSTTAPTTSTTVAG